MEQDSAGSLSDAINGHIDSDISHIEDGSYRSSWRKYQYQQYTAAQNSRRLGQAKEHIASSIRLMESMQDTYVEELQVPLEECAEMNVSLIKALDQVGHVLETGLKAGDMGALGDAVGGLKEHIARQGEQGVCKDGELQKARDLAAKYDEAQGLYREVLGSLEFVQGQKEALYGHNEEIYQKAKLERAMKQGAAGQMGAVLLKVEEQMYEAFPVSRSGADIINLSREPSLQGYFMEAEERLGVTPGEHVKALRSRSRKGSYQTRL